MLSEYCQFGLRGEIIDEFTVLVTGNLRLILELCVFVLTDICSCCLLLTLFSAVFLTIITSTSTSQIESRLNTGSKNIFNGSLFVKQITLKKYLSYCFAVGIAFKCMVKIPYDKMISNVIILRSIRGFFFFIYPTQMTFMDRFSIMAEKHLPEPSIYKKNLHLYLYRSSRSIIVVITRSKCSSFSMSEFKLLFYCYN